MALIRTPHAAIKIWNFKDRLNAAGVTASINDIQEIIVSTVSLISLETNKTKADPVGTFNATLAPTRNWTSVITPGSWCVILMSNKPLTANSFVKANPQEVKMLGRIESVRVDVSVDGDGTRQTRYTMSGQDWGSIFNTVLYVDPLVQDPSDPGKQMANALYQQFSENVFAQSNDVLQVSVPKNLHTLLSVMGEPLQLPKTDRLAKSTYDMSMPGDVSNYFQFIDGFGAINTTTSFMKLLTLVWGKLQGEDKYDNSNDELTGIGVLDPFSTVGQHTFWSLLQDNCNYALNEMFPEMFWPDDEEGGPQLLLYARVKPFCFTKNPASKSDPNLRSMFMDIASHKLPTEAVVSVSAGTNWRDKFNFIEIKPDIAEFNVAAQLLKVKSQAYQGDGKSSDVFNREGFRPISFSIKQLPFTTKKNGSSDPIDESILEKWVNTAKEWFFDGHRLLNGRLIMQGSSEYIPVGDNIMFDASLLGVTQNYNGESVTKNSPIYLLAHVESVQNHFSISPDGSRSFQTTIQFVRGIFVDESKTLIGEGTLDSLASALSESASKNSKTVNSKATSDNPGGEK